MDTELGEFPLPPEPLQSALIARVDDLTMLPTIAAEALDLARDPDCTPRQIAAVIEQDVKLTTEVLSMSNSAAFSSGRPISSLPQAIVRLGFRQCTNLILTSCVSSLMKRLPLEQEWIRELLWRHSFTTASACGHINRVFNLDFGGEEFTAGLLHDLGRLLLAVAEPSVFPDADPLEFQEQEDPRKLERDVLGTDHCCCGAWFALRAGLPEGLAAAILFHHDIHAAPTAQKLAATVAAADHIANHLQVHEGAKDYDPFENQGIRFLTEIHDPNSMEIFAGIYEAIFSSVLENVEDSSFSKMGAG